MLATTITAGHARSTAPAVALLRSFVGDGNGEGRISRLVEMGGATGFHSKGGMSMLSVSKQLITRLDMEFRRGDSGEGSVDEKKILYSLVVTHMLYI